jgi:hypothetical protein
VNYITHSLTHSLTRDHLAIMLYGDRNFLKASVTKSLVELQTRLINLYVSNLRSLGTQATLMGFFCVEGKQMYVTPCFV